MNVAWILPVMIAAALLLALLGGLWRISLWRRARASKVELIGGLLALPKRYLVDLHEVVARDRYIANTHVATAGGFVLASLLILLVFLFDLRVDLLEWALTAALLVVAVGALFVAARRRRNRPARLSKGPWNRLLGFDACVQCGRCETDLRALIDGRPQTIKSNPEGGFMLFRVGDAQASRNIHAAIYDSLRLCKDL